MKKKRTLAELPEQIESYIRKVANTDQDIAFVAANGNHYKEMPVEEQRAIRETIYTAVMKGADGAAKINAVIENLRNNPAKEVGGYQTLAVRDYQTGERTDFISGNVEKLDLPNSNVLYYEFDGAWCCVRPSGTEPKIKLYFGVKGSDQKEAEDKLERIKKGFLAITE